MANPCPWLTKDIPNRWRTDRTTSHRFFPRWLLGIKSKLLMLTGFQGRSYHITRHHRETVADLWGKEWTWKCARPNLNSASLFVLLRLFHLDGELFLGVATALFRWISSRIHSSALWPLHLFPGFVCALLLPRLLKLSQPPLCLVPNLSSIFPEIQT